MSKKNIKPNQLQPVIRTHIAKAALEGLTEENLTTGTVSFLVGGIAPGQCDYWGGANCSYDGDDAE